MIKRKWLSKLRKFSFVLLLLMTAVSYHPYFANIQVVDKLPNPLNKYIVILSVCTFLLYIKHILTIKNNFISKYILCIAASLFLSLISICIFDNNGYIEDIKSILLTFFFLTIGYSIKIDRWQLEGLVLAYSCTVIFATFMQVIINIGGFIITDGYIQYGKNALGVMNASSAVALLVMTQVSSGRKRLFCYLLYAIIFLLMVTIRARTAYLTLFLLTGYLIYSKLKRKQYRIHPLYILIPPLCIISLLIIPGVWKTLFGYVYDSFTQNHGGDITAGRTVRNISALNIITDSLFFGNLWLERKIGQVHNYPLRVLSSYGVLIGFPLLYLYTTLIVKSVRGMFDTWNLSNIGYIVMMVPMIISMAEPTFPYAPGTSTIFPFILLGVTLKNTTMNK